MKVTKQNKLQVKTASGVRTLEIVRINKAGIDARDIDQAGMPVLVTGFEFFGIRFFWEAVRNGNIAIA